MAVGVRPRSGWESLDLGFQMAREWWRQTWGVWLALYVPVAVVALTVFDNRFYGVMLLWWLKPLFDRAVLYSLSRQVFGEQGGVRTTLRAARDWLSPGLFLALTLRRFETARSFTLPVACLEKQTGNAAHQRRTVLGSRMRGNGIWLTVVCMHMEAFAMLAIFSLADLLTPGAMQTPESDGGLIDWVGMTDWNLTDAICYAAGVTLIEPFYVAAGFSLYLSRRTILEAWDMEVLLRQLSNRLRSAASAAAATLLCAMLLFGEGSGVAYAGEQVTGPEQTSSSRHETRNEVRALEGENPHAVIQQILADPAFEQYKEVKRWRSLEQEKQEPQTSTGYGRFFENISLLLADISQGLLWIGIAILVPVLLYILRHFIPEPQLRAAGGYVPPANLFGLDVAPESLPDDIPGFAAELARQGRAREALSLLYRAALSVLIHHHRVVVHTGDTEEQCVRAASAALDQRGTDFFAGLVSTWQQLAYGGTEPENTRVGTLCRDWSLHFQFTTNNEAPVS